GPAAGAPARQRQIENVGAAPRAQADAVALADLHRTNVQALQAPAVGFGVPARHTGSPLVGPACRAGPGSGPARQAGTTAVACFASCRAARQAARGPAPPSAPPDHGCVRPAPPPNASPPRSRSVSAGSGFRRSPSHQKGRLDSPPPPAGSRKE